MHCFNRLKTYKLEQVCKCSLFELKEWKQKKELMEIFKSLTFSDILGKRSVCQQGRRPTKSFWLEIL